MLQAAKPDKSPFSYKGSSGSGNLRDSFGKIINEILDGMSEADRIANVRVFDNDLEGSCGTVHIRKSHPEVFIQGGIMERGNFSAAAGFGSAKGRQGIFATFSAFLEMCISEITMSRLNLSNVLAHFSHSGVDEMADNTCHFGINSMYADGGVTPGRGDDQTRLYFPADQHQFAACLKRIFPDPGLLHLWIHVLRFGKRHTVSDPHPSRQRRERPCGLERLAHAQWVSEVMVHCRLEVDAVRVAAKLETRKRRRRG
jgi:transketolase C-terminal domain/subunit